MRRTHSPACARCLSWPAAPSTTPASPRATGAKRSPASPVRWKSPANTATAARFADPDQLVVAISQSGETADTLAALRRAKDLGHARTPAICNVPESAILRECALRFITRAGPEIAVAPNGSLLDKLKSNPKEVQARGAAATAGVSHGAGEGNGCG